MIVAGLVVIVVYVVVFSVGGSVLAVSLRTTPSLSLEDLLRESGATGKL